MPNTISFLRCLFFISTLAAVTVILGNLPEQFPPVCITWLKDCWRNRPKVIQCETCEVRFWGYGDDRFCGERCREFTEGEQ